MLSFTEIFKKSFLESFTNPGMDFNSVMVSLLAAAILGFYIYLTYRLVTRKTFYSRTFNHSLWAITVITSGIILAIQSNLVISLGMVGALSIVRFRTAIKDPMDLIFLFWAISNGIITGAGMYTLAVAMSVMITIGIMILEILPVGKAPMLLVINCDKMETETDILKEIKKFSRSNRIKTRAFSQGTLDLIIEVRVKKQQELVRALSEIPDISSVSLVAHDGEVVF